MDSSQSGSSVHGISQARILEWVAIPTPGDLPNPGMEPKGLVSLVLAVGFFTTKPPGKPNAPDTYCQIDLLESSKNLSWECNNLTTLLPIRVFVLKINTLVKGGTVWASKRMPPISWNTLNIQQS